MQVGTICLATPSLLAGVRVSVEVAWSMATVSPPFFAPCAQSLLKDAEHRSGPELLLLYVSLTVNPGMPASSPISKRHPSGTAVAERCASPRLSPLGQFTV